MERQPFELTRISEEEIESHPLGNYEGVWLLRLSGSNREGEPCLVRPSTLRARGEQRSKVLLTTMRLVIEVEDPDDRIVRDRIAFRVKSAWEKLGGRAVRMS